MKVRAVATIVIVNGLIIGINLECSYRFRAATMWLCDIIQQCISYGQIFSLRKRSHLGNKKLKQKTNQQVYYLSEKRILFTEIIIIGTYPNNAFGQSGCFR